MLTPLQVQALGGIGGLVIAFVVSVGIVAMGTYVGVLTALQSFFGSASWEEVRTGDGSPGESRPSGRLSVDEPD